MNYLLKGGRVVDPSQKLDSSPLDILVERGVIAGLGKNIAGGSATGRRAKSGSVQVLEMAGMAVVPGLVDMHTHLREPGYEYKETIHTGGEAALAGGFTAVACMANTNPVNDNRSVTEFIRRKALESALVKVYPVAAVTMGLEGKRLSEFGDLKDAGAVAFSDDGRPIMNAGMMRRALEYAASYDMPVISHCEDLNLSAGGAVNEGWMSTLLGLPAVPGVAEDVMVARDILLAGFTGAPLHIAHVSTKQAVSLIREAKARGLAVTAETAPHYFSLTEEYLDGFDPNGRVNPPLRAAEDVRALKDGLRDGTIDAIACDHAPHGRTDKEVEFEYAATGISGLETSLALSLKLVEEGVLTLAALVEKMSFMPARILRISGGTLSEGAPADITVIDLRRQWTVYPALFRSRGKNSPFGGRQLEGKALLTMVDGEIKYGEGGMKS